VVVTDRVPETRVWGFGSAVEKWVESRLNKAFLHFLPIFWAYLMIFQSGTHKSHCKTLKNHQIYSNILGENEENPCSTCLKPHFSADFDRVPVNLISGSPNPSLIICAVFGNIFGEK